MKNKTSALDTSYLCLKWAQPLQSCPTFCNPMGYSPQGSTTKKEKNTTNETMKHHPF